LRCSALDRCCGGGAGTAETGGDRRVIKPMLM
jgi:hypothetical protein